jgi:uncharacterized protein (TIGR00369 family)
LGGNVKTREEIEDLMNPRKRLQWTRDFAALSTAAVLYREIERRSSEILGRSAGPIPAGRGAQAAIPDASAQGCGRHRPDRPGACSFAKLPQKDGYDRGIRRRRRGRKPSASINFITAHDDRPTAAVDDFATLAARPRAADSGSMRNPAQEENDAMDPSATNALWRGLLGEQLGIRFVETGAERVVAEMEIRDALRTVGGALHGGALMAFADTVGGTATVINLPAGASTATIESKTNFFAAGKSGVVRAEATPLHKGRRTQVWQTRITDEAGKLLALTIQTQAVLEK